MTVAHFRVGQAWTAYVVPIVFSLVVAILGVALIVGGAVGSAAADTPDPAATIAAALPTAAAPPAKKGAHKVKGQATPALSASPSAEQIEAVKSGSHVMVLAGIGVLALAALVLAYRAMVIRSTRLSTNDDGIYFQRGILPWARHGHAVKWRDLEGAGHFGGFMSWALRSHTVRISHRFTKSSEIVMRHVGQAGNVVDQINDIHRSMLADPSRSLGIDAPR